MKERNSEPDKLNVIGGAVPRVDAIDKITGRARYGADHNRAGQLYGAVLHSVHPHAIVLSIDTEQARALDGVRAVLTHTDIPGAKSFGGIVPHQMVLCADKVRYVGDAVAIVAAETPEIAERAIGLIYVKYSPCQTIFDPEQALSPDSPLVHEGGNLCAHHKVRKGDIEMGFSKSDFIIEREYSTQKIEHSYIEPEAILAEPGENGGVTLIGSVQNLFSIRRAVAAVLGLPLNRVRVIQAALGGSFGGKDEAMSAICCRAALLALATGRSVKMVNTREQSMRESYKRHPYKLRYKVGVSKDGKLQAMEIRIVADAGAYAATSQFVTWRSVVQATGPYVVPHVKTDVYAAYTNNCYTGAMRGFGSPQVCFAVESLMDELAEQLDIDPLEMRLRNTLQDGSITATGQKLNHNVTIDRALKNVTSAADFGEKWKSNREQDKSSSIRKGIGISCSYRGVSLGAEGTDAVGVGISLQTDGSAVVTCGLVDMGQGAATTISLVVAEELGIASDKIVFLNADTTVMPDSGPTVASRTSFMAGNATRIGCAILKERIAFVAGEMLKCDTSSLVFHQSHIRGASGETTMAKLTAECFRRGISLSAHGWYKSPKTTWREEDGTGEAYFTFVYAANLAEVEVDTATGQVVVTKFISCHDVGKVLNMNGAKGQVFGGVAMGMGYALLEEYAEVDGWPMLANFDEYLLPTACDIPETKVIFIEGNDPLGPFGAKALGEPANEIAAPAIANAVANATGRRIRELPLTLERVLLGKNLAREGERGSARARGIA
jgi:CO/xanthine dehydrogenase Mo-binding subunit